MKNYYIVIIHNFQVLRNTLPSIINHQSHHHDHERMERGPCCGQHPVGTEGQPGSGAPMRPGEEIHCRRSPQVAASRNSEVNTASA